MSAENRLNWRALRVAAFLCFSTWVHEAGAQAPQAEANRVAEVTLTSAKPHADPFNEVRLDAIVTEPDGERLRVPAFWAGNGQWRFRYTSAKVGRHEYRTDCSDVTDRALHGVRGTIEVLPYPGDNALYRHGRLRVAPDHRHFEHADGTPFLWLGDTWWMGLCGRLHWPDEFKELTADRKAKGFNVVQIVAGLYPDMPAFDGRGANEKGFPWDPQYRAIRPEYFDAADDRFEYLADAGMVACIVGAWGYHLPWLGIEKMKQHWRYLIARYGALPVVWCVAGEGTMPYYLSKNKAEDAKFQKRGWTEIAAYIRATDPYHRLVTIHPGDASRNVVDDIRVLDFDMLQTGHSDRGSIPGTIRLVRASRSAQPPMPTVNGEVCYEGILDTCYEGVQRFMVWSCLLSGTAGHTYGANGIWQVNREGQPYGASPHGGNWGVRPWNQAMKLPGSFQTGLAKGLLEQYPWPRFEPHPEWAGWVADRMSLTWGDWIWFPEGDPTQDAPVAKRFFRKTVELPEGKTLAEASLRLTADDRFAVWLNGHPVGSHADWHSGKRFDSLAPWLKPGKNEIAVEAENVQASVPRNPAGLNGVLEAQFDDGTQVQWITDSSWRCSREGSERWRELSFDDSGWVQARRIAAYGESPWGQIGQSDPYQVPYAAGIPGVVRIIYVPGAEPVAVHRLESDRKYQGTYFDPVSGKRQPLGTLQPDAAGSWNSPEPLGKGQDWVLILESK